MFKSTIAIIQILNGNRDGLSSHSSCSINTMLNIWDFLSLMCQTTFILRTMITKVQNTTRMVDGQGFSFSILCFHL